MRKSVSGAKKTVPYVALLFCVCVLVFNATTLFKSKQRMAQSILKGRSNKNIQRDMGSVDVLLKLRNDIDLKGIEKRLPEISFANLERMSDARSVRIYVYSLPSRFNADLVHPNSTSLCSKREYSSEYMLHKWLQSSPYLTHSHKEADFFYVPAYGACSRDELGGVRLYKEALYHIAHRYPYFNRTMGRDHVWAVGSGAYNAVRGLDRIVRGVVLASKGSARDYVPYKDIVLPPNLDLYGNTSNTVALQRQSHRPRKKLFLFYSASPAYARLSGVSPPKPAAEAVQSARRCMVVVQKEANCILVNSTRYLLQYIYKATHCVCVDSQPDFYNCLSIAILFQCVPVIVGSHVGLPLEEAVNYGSFSIRTSGHRLCSVRTAFPSPTDPAYLTKFNEVQRIKRMFVYSRGGVEDVVVRLLAKRRPLVSLHG